MLRQGIQGISELITEPGLINVDFADVKSDHVRGRLGADGDRPRQRREPRRRRGQDGDRQPAARRVDGRRRGVLFNITGGRDLTLNEINDAAELIGQAADPDANIIFGAVVDDEMQGEVKITVIATGFDQIRPLQMGARTPRRVRSDQPKVIVASEPRPSRRFGSVIGRPGLTRTTWTWTSRSSADVSVSEVRDEASRIPARPGSA